MSRTWRWLARTCALALAVGAACGTAPVRADEGGAGHYLPGFGGYFAGMVPTGRGFYFANHQNQYVGAAGANVALPIGGKLRLGVLAYAFGEVPTVSYSTGRKVLGGTLGMTLAIPIAYLDATAAVFAGPVLRTVNDTNFRLGDIVLVPVMLGWQHGNLHWAFMGTVYVPTGDYHLGQLAPTGKNFWTFEPDFGFTYLNAKNGWELSTFAGVDFNSENTATHYQSGIDFHMDFTVANHVIRAIITPEMQKAMAAAQKAAAAGAPAPCRRTRSRGRRPLPGLPASSSRTWPPASAVPGTSSSPGTAAAAPSLAPSRAVPSPWGPPSSPQPASARPR